MVVSRAAAAHARRDSGRLRTPAVTCDSVAGWPVDAGPVRSAWTKPMRNPNSVWWARNNVVPVNPCWPVLPAAPRWGPCGFAGGGAGQDQRDGLGMGVHCVAQGHHDSFDLAHRVGGTRCGVDAGHDRVGDHVLQGGPVGDVVVQRHRGDSEFAAQRAHGQRGEPVAVDHGSGLPDWAEGGGLS
jgi:hypothetical protein